MKTWQVVLQIVLVVFVFFSLFLYINERNQVRLTIEMEVKRATQEVFGRISEVGLNEEHNRANIDILFDKVKALERQK